MITFCSPLQQKGLVRLSKYLGARFPVDRLSEEEARLGAVTPLLPVSPAPYRPSLSPPLPAHPWSHHARSVCLETDACLFLTNVQLLPAPDASQYPGPEKVKTLQEWEEQMGWVGRGWEEGTERWREEERWAERWGYQGAVDGDPETAFRSPDGESGALIGRSNSRADCLGARRIRVAVIRSGDYLGLLLLAPLDPLETPTATLHVILEDAQRVLLAEAGSEGIEAVGDGGGGSRSKRTKRSRIQVEVSADGYRWVRPTLLFLSE